MKYFLFRNAYLERIISIFICLETAEEMATVFKAFYVEERMSIVLGNILNWNICNFSIPRVYWVNSLNWISHVMQELMFRWRRGKLHLRKFARGKYGAKKCDVRTGIDVAFKRFICPLSGDFDHKLCRELRCCYPQKGIFYNIWTIFQSPGSGIWPKNSIAAPMPLLPSHPPTFQNWYLHIGRLACVAGVRNGRERVFGARPSLLRRAPSALFTRPKSPFPSLLKACHAA